jgi:hypothetical protein
MPVSITSEIARLENKDGQRCHDESLALKVKSMSKITLASSSEVWLVSLPGNPFNHFLSNDMEGLGLTGCKAVFQESLVREIDATAQINTQVEQGGENRRENYSIPKEFVDTAKSYLEVPATRSRDRDEMFQNVSSTRSRNEMIQEVPDRLSRDPEEILDAFPVTRSRLRADTTITTPAANSILSSDRTTTEHETRTVAPELEHRTIKWKNVPKQPIPELKDVSLWIGHQLHHERMPKEYRNLPPEGKLISSMKGHPEGLLAVPNEEGSPRIIVLRSQILALVTH